MFAGKKWKFVLFHKTFTDEATTNNSEDEQSCKPETEIN